MIDMARKANFFLIGAAKAGTTSIDRLLRGHPEVYLSPIKEPCHFCPDVNALIRAEAARQVTIKLDKYLDAGCPEIVHQHLVDRPEDYARLFAAAPVTAKILGDCSTFYMVSSDAPEHVHAYNPEAKIVAILRNPVDRIRSHYEMDRRIGLERRNLEECLQQEIGLGPRAHYGNSRYYLGACDYVRQIERWRNIFGAKQVLVLDFAELVSCPDLIKARLFLFLGLSAQDGAGGIVQTNAFGKFPRLAWLDHWLYRSGLQRKLKILLKTKFPPRVFEFLKNVYLGTAEGEVATESGWKNLKEVTERVEGYKDLVGKKNCGADGEAQCRR